MRGGKKNNNQQWWVGTEGSWPSKGSITCHTHTHSKLGMIAHRAHSHGSVAHRRTKQTHTERNAHAHVCVARIFKHTHAGTHTHTHTDTLGASLLLHTVGPSVRPDKVASESQLWFERGDLMTTILPPPPPSPPHFPSASPSVFLLFLSFIHSRRSSQFVSFEQSIYLIPAISLFRSLLLICLLLSLSLSVPTKPIFRWTLQGRPLK